jgi:hypothetical protein
MGNKTSVRKLDFFKEFKYTSRQFGIWRIAFGMYLFVYFLKIFPFREEVYINHGICPGILESGETFFGSFFPKFMLYLSLPQVELILSAALIFSFLIMVGLYRRVAAFGLWFMTNWLGNCAPTANSPELDYVNWLIVALVLIPAGEKYSLGRKNPGWYMPRNIYWGAWIVIAFAYFYAGYIKLQRLDPSWVDGKFMYYLVQTHIFRYTWYGDFFENLPVLFFKIWSWSALLFETGAFLFVPFRQSRIFWWVMSTSAVLVSLALLNISQVFFGMLLYHLFLIDLNWINEAKALKNRKAARVQRN